MVDAGRLVDDGADQPLGLTGVERLAKVGVGVFDVAGKHAERAEHAALDAGAPSRRRRQVGQQGGGGVVVVVDEREADAQYVRGDVMLVELGDQRRCRRRVEAQRLGDGLLAEHLADGRVGLGVAAPGLTEQRFGADLVAEHAGQLGLVQRDQAVQHRAMTGVACLRELVEDARGGVVVVALEMDLRPVPGGRTCARVRGRPGRARRRRRTPVRASCSARVSSPSTAAARAAMPGPRTTSATGLPTGWASARSIAGERFGLPARPGGVRLRSKRRGARAGLDRAGCRRSPPRRSAGGRWPAAAAPVAGGAQHGPSRSAP